MSEEIRTPAGRTLRLSTTHEDATRIYEIDGRDELSLHVMGDDVDAFTIGDYHSGSLAGCLSWLDARADETVAALLPPGAIVVTEERVRELAKVLVDRYAESGDGCASEDCQKPHIDALLSALRAGAKS